MNKVKEVTKKIVLKVTSFIPTRVPLSYDAYNNWIADIIELAGPIADKESLAWVVSNEVMRQPTGKDYISKHTFVKLIRKFAANQFAANKVNEIKKAQEERQLLEKQQAGNTNEGPKA